MRSFRLLTGGQFASTIGDFCYAVALPWLVLSAHGGAILLGVVLACYGVPRTVLIPVGGVLADKVGLVAVAILGGLTQREFRTFGAREVPQAAIGSDAEAKAADALKAALGSRK